MADLAADTALNGLASAMTGDVITPDHLSYDEARKVWNGDIDRRPAVIARCATVEDVVAAVAYGRESGLPIAIRSGGHSFPGHGVVEGGLVIDMRQLNAVTVDPETGRATVGGGAIWSEVDGPAQEHGLAVTSGHVSHTGVAGLTLGGGVGHLMRKYGLSIDSLISVQIVTADGRILRAAANENEDLYWGVRGGGGNFGVVTQFEFQLHEFGTEVYAGLVFWAPEHGPELMRRYRDVTNSMSDDANTILLYMHAPPMPFVPEDVQFKPGYAMLLEARDRATGEAVLDQMRAVASPLFEMVTEMPYLFLQTLIDPANPHGTKAYLKGGYFDGYSDEVIKVITELTAKMPPGHSQMIILQLGGAMSRVPDEATAFAGRDAGFMAMFQGIWEEDADRPAAVEWSRTCAKAMEPFIKGVYINLADSQSDAALEATYGPEKYTRLRQLKTKYDPQNLFKINQNIKPL